MPKIGLSHPGNKDSFAHQTNKSLAKCPLIGQDIYKLNNMGIL